MKMSSSEKARVILAFFAVLYLVLAYLGGNWVAGMGIPFKVYIILQTLLMGIIASYIVRVMILKEPEKLREDREGYKDSFARFYRLRNIDSPEILPQVKTDVHMYELSDGHSVIFFKVLFGESSDIGTLGTIAIYEKIFSLAGEARLEVTSVVMDEDFSSSPEYKVMTEQLSGIEDPKLSRAMRQIFSKMMEITSEKSSVDSVVFRLKTTSIMQRYRMDEFCNTLFNFIEGQTHNFRSFRTMDRQDLLNFMRTFYKLEVIDLARIRVENISKADSVLVDLVEIISFTDTNGVEYSSKRADSEYSTAKKLNL
jgi:hypothetical protein